MAGDFIKVEKATARKPEVLQLADLLGVHPRHAFGLCIEFWIWCDDQMDSGHAKGVTNVTLDSVIGHKGFCDALVTVGWLQARNGSLVVPNFDRHLSQSAKTRADATRRKQIERSHKSCDKNATREEKRREDINTKSNTGQAAFSNPSVEDVAAYCRERKNEIDPQRFVDFYASKGWMVGKNKMKDWRAAVRNWEANNAASRGSSGDTRKPTNRVDKSGRESLDAMLDEIE